MKKYYFLFFLIIIPIFLGTLYDSVKNAKISVPVSIKINTSENDLLNYINIFRESPSGNILKLYKMNDDKWHIKNNYVKNIIVEINKDNINKINNFEFAYNKKNIRIIKNNYEIIDLENSKYSEKIKAGDNSVLFIFHKNIYNKKSLIPVSIFNQVLNWPGDFHVLLKVFIKSLFFSLWIFVVFLPFIIIIFAHFNKNKEMLDFINDKIYFILIYIILVFIIQSVFNILYNKPLLDGGKYLIRAWWNINGKIPLYGPEGKTGYMPLFYLLLGLWQKIFGKGFISGGIFVSIISILNIILMYFITYKITNKKYLAVLPCVFLTATPISVFYFNTVLPFSLISMISLLIILIFVYNEKLKWWLSSILIGSGYMLLYFTRRNMILGVGLFIIFQIIYFKNKKILRTCISIFIMIFFIFLSLFFFHRSFIHTSISLPVISKIIQKRGIYKNPYSSISKFREKGIVTEKMKEKKSRAYGIKKTIKSFVFSYFYLYAFVIILCVLGIFYWIKKKSFINIFGFFIIYFFIMSIIHFIISQSYCPTCIKPYTNYFYVIGCMGAVFGFEFLEKILTENTFINKFVLFSILIIILSVFGIQFSSRFPQNQEIYSKQLNKTSLVIKDIVPENEKVLVLGGLYHSVQAVYMADKIFELTNLNISHNYKGKLKDNLSSIDKIKALRLLKEDAKWTDEMMEYWIKEKYDYIILGEGAFSVQYIVRDEWISLINEYFNPVEEINVTNESKLIIYNRI